MTRTDVNARQAATAEPLTLPAGWWARAVSVAERLAVSAGAPDPSPATTEGLLAPWRTAHAHLPVDTLALATAGLGTDEAGLARALAEAPADLARRLPAPSWARTAEAVLTLPGHDGEDLPAADGFGLVMQPFTRYAVRRILSCGAFDAEAALLDRQALTAAFATGVTARLAGTAARTLVLELHRARAAGRLTGADPRARFRDFCRQAARAEWLGALFTAYPVLARLLATTATQAADAFTEFLRRWSADRELVVRELFGAVAPGPLTGVDGAAGDPHDGGRSVLLLTFATGRRLVYKPRPMAVHRHYNEALTWFAGHLGDAAPAPRVLRLADRGPYGWVEFAEAGPCADLAATERFFHALGAQLALLHVLGATDLHFENLVAAGEHPVAVDLETLLHTGLPQLTGDPYYDDDPATRYIARSVARVGVLPAVLATGGGALDVGGLGGDAGVPLPFPAAAWEDSGTDAMRLVRVRQMSRGGDNKAVLGGVPAEPRDYTEQICAGFAAGYRTLRRHSAELTTPGGLLDRFTGDDLRLVARATRTYARLLDETTHPRVLRDAADRDRVLTLLWSLAARDPARLALARHELRDIWAGDIPLFRVRAGSRDPRATDGTPLPGLLGESGVDQARRLVATLCDDDLARQDLIIRSTLATRSAATGLPALRTAHGSAPTPAGATPRDRALDAARRVAVRLEAHALHGSGRTSWWGMDLTVGNQWQVTPLGGDLFSGHAGIGLFFAQIARVLGDSRHAATARLVLEPLATHSAAADTAYPGAYAGTCGAAYALACAATLLDEPELAAPVDRLLALTAAAVADDDAYDMMSGAAGCLAVAETLWSRHSGPAAELADRSAAVLLRSALPTDDGLAWPTRLEASRPLLGFSHGAAGIGWALLRYADRTGDTTCRDAGAAALAHESAQFDTALDNWPDFRTGDSRPWAVRPAGGSAHPHAWCHGAPGVGLARAALPERARTAATDADLRRALVSTTAFGAYGNHSLCHGDLGNLELFTAAAALGMPGADEERARRVGILLDQFDAHGPLCGTPGALTSPGLMTGLAGIGHGLLRIVSPDGIAPVLLLAEQR